MTKSPSSWLCHLKYRFSTTKEETVNNEQKSLISFVLWVFLCTDLQLPVKGHLQSCSRSSGLLFSHIHTVHTDQLWNPVSKVQPYRVRGISQSDLTHETWGEPGSLNIITDLKYEPETCPDRPLSALGNKKKKHIEMLITSVGRSTLII